ncbi:MAG: FAD-dependent oxidoreductase [Pseudomonadota bacterium]|nr:FAD-dependent oxidoreductase [Pseudomonadota bacterium]
MVKIAIIGAGLSGLTLASFLSNHASVTIFEKSRGYGGRIATRYSGDYFFDHGAQFFTAHSDSFKNFVKPMIVENIISNWNARFAEMDGGSLLRSSTWDHDYPHYVGVPGMNAIGKYLAESLNVKLNTKVTKLSNKKYWELEDQNGNFLGEFDWVISSAPALQTREIFPSTYQNWSELEKVAMESCFSLMLGFKHDLNLGFDAALVKNADISWISVNSSKPGRKGGYSLLIHSTNKWATTHIDDDRDNVISHLLSSLSMVLNRDLSNADHVDLQAWRYANMKKHKLQFEIDPNNKLAVCGDWLIKGRIECAFLSAKNVYNQFLKYL